MKGGMQDEEISLVLEWALVDKEEELHDVSLKSINMVTKDKRK